MRITSWSDTSGYDIATIAGPIAADTVFVANRYDHEGRVLTVARWTRPDSAKIDTLDDDFLYDEAGRKTSESTTAGVDKAYSYDPADTAYFAYDAVGNMTRADNGSARIRRTYAPGGLMLTDSSFVRILRYTTSGNAIVASDFTSHEYGLRYGYDAAGRLDSLWLPEVLDPCAGACPAQRYTYDANTGRLASVIDVRSDTIRFAYNTAGALSHIGFPGIAHTVLDSTVYDVEGRVMRHQVTIDGAAFIADSLYYDPMGRILADTGKALGTGYQLSVENAYTGLGALAATAHASGSTPVTEEFRVDGLGDTYWSRQYHLHLGGGTDEPAIRLRPYEAGGRLLAVTTADTARQTGETDDHYWYDDEGRTTYHTHLINTGTSFLVTQEADYYDGNERLVQLQRHNGWFGDTANANDPAQVIETYRYDALGRRVLVHALHNSSCTTNGCESSVARFVWADNQLIAETRGPASDATSNATVESDAPGGNGEFGAPEAYGRVVYTQAGGIDRPLGLIRINSAYTVLASLYPQSDWRGLYVTATTESGALYSSANVVPFAGVRASAYLGQELLADSVLDWFGSMVTEQQDASGLLYRRNRYYDPVSGRFTQPDPAGISGGLNTYGFAGADPINNSDPFGRCAVPNDSIEVIVQVKCPGQSSPEVDTVWAQKVNDPGAATSVKNDASRLYGGSSQYTPADVQAGYGGVEKSGQFYIFPLHTAHGGVVITGGGTTPLFVSFRADYWQLIRSGNLNSAPSGFRESACTVFGHEGVHLVQFSRGRSQADPLLEPEAYGTPWSCR